MNTTKGQQYAKELEMEVAATRKCLERMKEELFDWKPHEKSMKMGYLALVTAEIPRWISVAIADGEVNFATFKGGEAKTAEELVKLFESNVAGAKKALEGVSDEELEKMFYLKRGDTVLMQDSKDGTISSSINHMVHHRGQLTVYMRLNGIPVPAIYGPSADDKTF